MIYATDDTKRKLRAEMNNFKESVKEKTVDVAENTQEHIQDFTHGAKRYAQHLIHKIRENGSHVMDHISCHAHTIKGKLTENAPEKRCSLLLMGASAGFLAALLLINKKRRF